MKHISAGLTCVAALVVSLAACGGDNKAAPPTYTGGSGPATTATTQPATTPPTPVPTGTKAGPAELAAHSTYTYGGLKVVVNLPADIPSASRPSLRLLSEFLQADGRTTARSKLDPSLSNLATANVVKDTEAAITAESVQGIGSVTYTISKIQTAAGRTTEVTGCLDQSKIVHLRKDGSQFVDPNAKKYPTLKMSANVVRGITGPKVTAFTFVPRSC